MGREGERHDFRLVCILQRALCCYGGLCERRVVPFQSGRGWKGVAPISMVTVTGCWERLVVSVVQS